MLPTVNNYDTGLVIYLISFNRVGFKSRDAVLFLNGEKVRYANSSSFLGTQVFMKERRD